jgi:hypothetical protein
MKTNDDLIDDAMIEMDIQRAKRLCNPGISLSWDSELNCAAAVMIMKIPVFRVFICRHWL